MYKSFKGNDLIPSSVIHIITDKYLKMVGNLDIDECNYITIFVVANEPVTETTPI